MKKLPLRHLVTGLALVGGLALAACGGGAPKTAAGPTAPPPAATTRSDPTTSPTPPPLTTTGNDTQPDRFPPERYDDLEIVTLLPQDAIPAIDNPQFLSAAEADSFYDPDELVMGVAFEGEARAYSVPFLSRHEIVNDQIGGVEFAVTW